MCEVESHLPPVGENQRDYTLPPQSVTTSYALIMPTCRRQGNGQTKLRFSKKAVRTRAKITPHIVYPAQTRQKRSRKRSPQAGRPEIMHPSAERKQAFAPILRPFPSCAPSLGGPSPGARVCQQDQHREKTCFFSAGRMHFRGENARVGDLVYEQHYSAIRFCWTCNEIRKKKKKNRPDHCLYPCFGLCHVRLDILTHADVDTKSSGGRVTSREGWFMSFASASNPDVSHR